MKGFVVRLVYDTLGYSENERRVYTGVINKALSIIVFGLRKEKLVKTLALKRPQNDSLSFGSGFLFGSCLWH